MTLHASAADVAHYATTRQHAKLSYGFAKTIYSKKNITFDQPTCSEFLNQFLLSDVGKSCFFLSSASSPPVKAIVSVLRC